MLAAAFLFAPPAVQAQVDQQLAASFFKEAQARCEADGGKLWGISLCGPMVVADPVTRTLASTQPAPSAPWPAGLGYFGAPVEWDPRH